MFALVQCTCKYQDGKSYLKHKNTLSTYFSRSLIFQHGLVFSAGASGCQILCFLKYFSWSEMSLYYLPVHATMILGKNINFFFLLKLFPILHWIIFVVEVQVESSFKVSCVHREILLNPLRGFIQNCYLWEKTPAKNRLSVITYIISLILDSNFNKYVTPRSAYFSTSAYMLLMIWGRRKNNNVFFLCLLNRAQSRSNMVYTETRTHHIHIASSIALAQCFFSLSENQKY